LDPTGEAYSLGIVKSSTAKKVGTAPQEETTIFKEDIKVTKAGRRK